uniref:Xylanolytic transcriptional activator regulatory domain-containing protein n=1 Tax=Cryptococcus bacillisporus CA1280 TaxID=1296109 RepID=A0A0D0VL16_CRYGA|nr:hypothetical protein I312_04993 [Cryptococcus bacillisporus CA1280]
MGGEGKHFCVFASAVINSTVHELIPLLSRNSLHKQLKTLSDENELLRSILENYGISRDEAAAGVEQRPIRSIPVSSIQRSLDPISASNGFYKDNRSGQVIHHGSSTFHSILGEQDATSPHAPASSSHAYDNFPYQLQNIAPDVIGFHNLPSDIHEELLDLFFTYINGYCVNIDREAFMEGMNSGGPSASYSRLLHLAILTEASHLSLHPQLRSDPDDIRTAGIAFQSEAMALLQLDMEPQVTTALALCMFCTTISDCGQIFQSWLMAGNAVRIAQHVGLHLENPTVIGEKDKEARRRGMWGIFLQDK